MTDDEKNVGGDEPRKSVNGWDALDEHIDTLKDKYKRDGGHGNAYEYKFSRTTGTAQSNDGFIATQACRQARRPEKRSSSPHSHSPKKTS